MLWSPLISICGCVVLSPIPCSEEVVGVGDRVRGPGWAAGKYVSAFSATGSIMVLGMMLPGNGLRFRLPLASVKVSNGL